MSELKLVIKNCKSTSTTQENTKRQCFSNSLPAIPMPQSLPNKNLFEEKLQKLEGNLKMLEKQYRSNLKQGFDNKIKAYRLQAFVERKLLKKTIQETQRAHQAESIRQKMLINEHQKEIGYSRVEIMRMQREERERFLRQNNHRQKKKYSLSIHERQSSLNRSLRQAHDKIIEAQANINKKRDYLDFIKRNKLKKEEMTTKKYLLDKIVEKTERLKELKYTLEDLKGPPEDTFVTL